ncbi:HNH endonuclease [Kineococcus gynurae]|uniref:HNH endonuclease n=1 Tax=Kineococcus gynurae TaxID=452979 RepID=A0ABV5LSI6_9ACTN
MSTGCVEPVDVGDHLAPRDALTELLQASERLRSTGHAMAIDAVIALLDWVRREHPDVVRARDLGCTRDGEELTPELLDHLIAEVAAMILAEARHLSHLQAVGQVGDAEDALQDPVLQDAYRAGAITATHRAVIRRAHDRLAAREATLVPVEGSEGVRVGAFGEPVLDGDALTAARAELTRSALECIAAAHPTPQQLTRHCTKVIRRLTPEHVPVAVRVADANRHVSIDLCDTGEDSGLSAHLTALVGKDVAVRFDRWLTAAADAAADHATATGTRDDRTHQQRRADVFTDVLTTAMREGVPALSDPTTPAEPGEVNPVTRVRTHRPASSTTVHVTIAARTLLGLDDEPAEVAGIGPVPGALARALAADGDWRRILTDPVSGEVLDVSPRTYRPGNALRRFVQTRDRTCTTPGCLVTAIDCDLDHRIPFEEGGRTVRSNLHAACRRHHRQKTLYVFEHRAAHRRRTTAVTPPHWPGDEPPF